MFDHKNPHWSEFFVSLCFKQHAAESKQPKAVALIKTDSTVESSVDPLGVQKVPDDCFKPFIFDGLVFLLCYGILPFRSLLSYLVSCPWAMWCLYLWSKCSGTRYQNVPALCTMYTYIKVNYWFLPVSSPLLYPIEGVDFTKGNDINDCSIYPVPEVVDSPIL